MNKVLFTGIIIFTAFMAKTQKVDSIYFHLYTDSLKKGVHNYINVDGKLSNGKWIPITTKEILFTSLHGVFESNDLILPSDFKDEKVYVNVVLKSNPSIQKETTIWIKQLPDPDKLPTEKEIKKDNKRKN